MSLGLVDFLVFESLNDVFIWMNDDIQTWTGFLASMLHISPVSSTISVNDAIFRFIIVISKFSINGLVNQSTKHIIIQHIDIYTNLLQVESKILKSLLLSDEAYRHQGDVPKIFYFSSLQHRAKFSFSVTAFSIWYRWGNQVLIHKTVHFLSTL